MESVLYRIGPPKVRKTLSGVHLWPVFRCPPRTGLWLGRALIAKETEKALPRGFQDALTDGWPSWFNFIGSILPFAAAAVAFLYAWWAAIVMFFLAVFLGTFMEKIPIFPRQLRWYVGLLASHLDRRRKSFEAKGDTARALAAKDLLREVSRVMLGYLGYDVPAPDTRTALNAPCGEPSYLLRIYFEEQARRGKMSASEARILCEKLCERPTEDDAEYLRPAPHDPNGPKTIIM